MAKKKRRANSLSRMDKALMQAYQYKNQTPDGFKIMVADCKNKYAELVEHLGVVKRPSDEIQYSQEGRRYVSELQENTGDELRTLTMLRDFILGYWVKHKIAYRVPKETVDFIENEFKVEYLKVPIKELLETALQEPIYIELDTAVGPQEMFAGAGPFLLDVLSKGQRDCALMLSFLTNDEADQDYIRILGTNADDSVCQHIESLRNEKDENTGGEGRFESDAYIRMLKILIYIGFVAARKDCYGTVIIEDMSKAYKAFKLLPIPYKDSIPDLSVRGGWISAGLCHHMGYLDRNHMRKDLEETVAGSGMDSRHLFVRHAGDRVNSDEVVQFASRMILDWEYEKTVYQYEDSTAEKLWDKYAEEVCLDGISNELMQYMPYETVVLSSVDTGQISLISQCSMQNTAGKVKDSLFVCVIGNGAPETTIVEADCPVQETYSLTTHPVRRLNLTLYVLVILYHVLKVMQQKALKRALRPESEPLPPDTMALVPVGMKARVEAREHPNIALYHGYAVEEEPLRLMDVTLRTVKTVPYKQAVARMGWKMRPHVRRAHVHHYWVGHGDDKHLIERHLERMRINCGNGKVQPTTIHEIR